MNKVLKKITIYLTIFVLGTVNVFAQGMPVSPDFNPNILIQDKVFTDIQTFGGPAGIQKFLESKGSILANTSQEFITKLKEPSNSSLKTALEDPQPNLPRLRSAAELIWDASQHSGLNPQVILVTLQKEQGLITNHQNTDPVKLQRVLDIALGFACPDSGGCGALYLGFYFQLFGNLDESGNRYLGAARSLMKSFNTPGGRGPQMNGKLHRVGDVVTLQNTLGGYDGILPEQSVMLSNLATAALYRYTPHVFNGNYNFWKYHNEWFKYPNGTIVQIGNNPIRYIIQNGFRLLLPTFVAQARGLDLASTVVVSQTEMENYQENGLLGPADNTVVQVNGVGQKYVFLDNEKRPVSDLVLKQRALHNSPVLSISPEESSMFKEGLILPPSDGTVVRGEKDPAVYLVLQGKLKMFSAFTFSQHKAASKMQIIPDAELATYPKGGFVPPLDGTFVKANNDNTVFEFVQGNRHALTFELFKNRGVTAKQVVTLTPDEVNSAPVTSYSLPKEKTFYVVKETGEQYYVKEGVKKPLLSLVIKQQRITPDYTFGKAESDTWPTGIPVAPRNGTVIKGADSATVYLVENGQLRPLTYTAFKARKITASKIVTVSEIEVEQYAKGEVLEK